MLIVGRSSQSVVVVPEPDASGRCPPVGRYRGDVDVRGALFIAAFLARSASHPGGRLAGGPEAGLPPSTGAALPIG